MIICDILTSGCALIVMPNVPVISLIPVKYTGESCYRHFKIYYAPYCLSSSSMHLIDIDIPVLLFDRKRGKNSPSMSLPLFNK